MRTTWRIGSTSYVYPGDLLHNLRALAGEVDDVDDVELILFDDGNGTSNLPSADEVREMSAILCDAATSVTVHLPCDVGGLMPDDELESALHLNRRVIVLTRPLEPRAYIFHAHTQGAGTDAWRDSVVKGVREMATLVDDSRQLALENLESYSPEHVEPILAALEIRRALDIGHLWKQRRDPMPVMVRWLPQTSVVHLHGVCEDAGRMVDHLSLARMEEKGCSDCLDLVLRALNGWEGVLTLEVFEEDYFTSRAALNRALQRISTEARHAD